MKHGYEILSEVESNPKKYFLSSLALSRVERFLLWGNPTSDSATVRLTPSFFLLTSHQQDEADSLPIVSEETRKRNNGLRSLGINPRQSKIEYLRGTPAAFKVSKDKRISTASEPASRLHESKRPIKANHFLYLNKRTQKNYLLRFSLQDLLQMPEERGLGFV